MAEAKQRDAGLLEAGYGHLDRRIELEDVAARGLDLDQFGNAGLAVGLDGRGKTELRALAGEVGDGDVRLQLEAEMQERLLLRRAQNQVVVVVADREVDRSVVALGRLGHAEGREIVVLRPFDVRRFQRDVPELEHLRIEFPLHCAFLLKTSSNRRPVVGLR